MSRRTRYQGAIVHDDQILLIKHRMHADGREYWVIPGGGLEGDEAEAACVQREMREETGLEVAVERLLLEEPAFSQDDVYQVYKTFLCRVVAGQARPGYEPEPAAAAAYSISEVGWFHLRDGSAWDAALRADPVTYPQVRKLQAALGYAPL
jgi:ADP-ribose pyrophosphatase YjhB (NUDIX family)